MGPVKVRCPGCGGWKTDRARLCKRCARTELASGAAEGQTAIGRSIDHAMQARSEWRPDHWPPACPTCHGFGYVQTSEGEHADRIEYPLVSRHGNTMKEVVPARRRLVAGNERVDRNGSRAGGWHDCPDCIGHKGSVMTHPAWLAVRGG